MFSYPAVHSTVPGWLLALLSVAMGAAGALAELVPARGRRAALHARALLAVAAAVDAAEAVAYAIAMTMWLKRYTGVPRPNFAAFCKGAAAADGRIECTTKHGARARRAGAAAANSRAGATMQGREARTTAARRFLPATPQSWARSASTSRRAWFRASRRRARGRRREAPASMRCAHSPKLRSSWCVASA
jgi:hypothetical protein